MTNLDPAIIRRLRYRRASMGLSQGELAKRMGTGQSTLCDLESGERDPRLSTLYRWAAALDLRARVDFDEVPEINEEPSK